MNHITDDIDMFLDDRSIRYLVWDVCSPVLEYISSKFVKHNKEILLVTPDSKGDVLATHFDSIHKPFHRYIGVPNQLLTLMQHKVSFVFRDLINHSEVFLKTKESCVLTGYEDIMKGLDRAKALEIDLCYLLDKPEPLPILQNLQKSAYMYFNEDFMQFNSSDRNWSLLNPEISFEVLCSNIRLHPFHVINNPMWFLYSLEQPSTIIVFLTKVFKLE